MGRGRRGTRRRGYSSCGRKRGKDSWAAIKRWLSCWLKARKETVRSENRQHVWHSKRNWSHKWVNVSVLTASRWTTRSFHVFWIAHSRHCQKGLPWRYPLRPSTPVRWLDWRLAKLPPRLRVPTIFLAGEDEIKSHWVIRWPKWRYQYKRSRVKPVDELPC